VGPSAAATGAVLPGRGRRENAWLVGPRSPVRGWTPRQIATKAFELADGCLISLKKDGLTAIGGLLGLRDDELFPPARRT